MLFRHQRQSLRLLGLDLRDPVAERREPRRVGRMGAFAGVRVRPAGGDGVLQAAPELFRAVDDHAGIGHDVQPDIVGLQFLLDRRQLRLAAALLLATGALLLAAGAGAEEPCYRADELRADAEAKLAVLLERAAQVCTGVLNGPALQAWNGFRQAPDIAAGLAAAEARRAGLYQRLYGADWQARRQKAETEAFDYASYVLLKSDFDVAGCARLTQRLNDFSTGGWPAYGAAVDRIDLIARPQVSLCE